MADQLQSMYDKLLAAQQELASLEKAIKEHNRNENETFVAFTHYGCTEIRHSKNGVTVSHAGGMGTRFDQVRANVDKLLFEGAFDQLRAEGVEDGDPSYMYTLTLSKEQYNDIVNDLSV